ncbi:hypothetical protein ACLOJK_003077 [Asimina triloba]
MSLPQDKMRKTSCADEDRLSNLAPNVLEAILMHLPLKDAVRTSILSSKWRNTWTAIPHLVINYSCDRPHPKQTDLDQLRRVNIVDQVLLRHQGRPIHKFELWARFLESCPHIDRWILFLSNHGIKELIFIFFGAVFHKLPSSLFFSCQDLQYLKLRSFIIDPPPTITGLDNLKHLALCKVSITDVSLQRLLSACKFLEKLSLVLCKGLSRVEILAQRLKRIQLWGSFQGLLFDTPLLASAQIRVESLANDVEEEKREMGESGVCNLIKVLGGLRDIQELEVYEHCLKFLASGKVPKKLLTTYKHLKHLCLSIDFSNVNEISTAFCLITSAPYVQKLHIHISGTTGAKNELDLMEYVLANAPLLATMTVRMRRAIDDESAFLRNLVQFRRASSHATIKCLVEGSK